MTLHRLTLSIDADRATETEALLRLAGAVAVSLVDARDSPLFEPAPGTAPLWPRLKLAALFPDHMDPDRLERIATLQLGDSANVKAEPLPDTDWQFALRQSVAPIEVGETLRIIPAAAPDSSDGRIDVRLNVGLAFGTGRHPTTGLCLESLSRHVRDTTRLLDFGTGSGILALAALKLGAASAWATDNDPQALAAIRRNAELNVFAGALWVGPVGALPELRPTLIVANILATTLIELETSFAERLEDGGRIILSGILDQQAEAVIAAYTPDFSDFDVTRSAGWVGVCAVKRLPD